MNKNMKNDIRTTRYTLIQRMKDPLDETAWNEFYNFYWDLITGWAKMFGCSNTLAQDIFQETIVSLIRALPKFEYQPDKGLFRSYLKTIVQRRVSDAFRKESRYIPDSGSSDDIEHHTAIEDSIDEKTANTESEMDKVWLQSLLSQALRKTYKKVDQPTYKSFCLYVLEGLPVKEVSERMGGIREGTVYQQKSRFLGYLKEEFTILLEDLEDQNISMKGDSENKFFFKAFEELVSNHPDYRETVFKSTPPKQLLNRMTFVRKCLKSNPPPTEKGFYLFYKDWCKIEDKFAIGRDNSCDLIIDDDNVSGLHSTISLDGVTVSIKDENSANGTFLNSEKITEKQLKSGDVIQIAGKNLLFTQSI